MGGAVSAGQTNDELIDNLVEADYIKTPEVERVFRGVDRADYYLPEHRDSAYKDLAWKNGNIHLSAPCIYAEVMESLKLEAGLSFLNLGSGTGYLSTLAGLLLGSHGSNHGVEYHVDVIEYARERLEHFKQAAAAFDEYDFCEPSFSHGNCLLITSGSPLYDRVYCGASCPKEHENYMKNLIKVGGILVMPLEDHLLQITRTSETTWDTKSILPVSFASLITPSNDNGYNHVDLPEKKALTLQENCRVTVRAILRQNIRIEHPNINKVRRRPKRSRRRRSDKRRRINIIPVNMGMMLLGGLNESDSDDDPANQSEDSSHDSDGAVGPQAAREDPGTDYILQQMRAMQRHFMDLSRGDRLERLQEDGDHENLATREADEDDQGIDVADEEEASDDTQEKRTRAGRRAALENGRRAVQENGTVSADSDDDNKGVDLTDFFAESGATFRAPSQPANHCTEDHEVESPAVTGAIPITQTNAERRRYSSTTSMSTSVTSGLGTCSSIEEEAPDFDAISRELQTCQEEGLGVHSNGTSNGHYGNGKQDHNGKKSSQEPSTSEVTNCEKASPERSTAGCSMDYFCGPRPGVSITTPPQVVHSSDASESEKHEDDTDDDIEDVDMEAVEKTETESPEERLTFRDCMRDKVELLPIPHALKQYVLYYRT